MTPDQITGKRILLSPLNWGMGHVARCIPLIDQLIRQKNTLIIAANIGQQQVLKCYFPELEYILWEDYPFHFRGKGNFSADLLLAGPQLIKRLFREQKEVKSLVKTNAIDLIISDHRYGFRSAEIPSIFITHQLNLPVRWFEFPVQLLHQHLMNQFSYIWVPDTPDSILAGKLSINKTGGKNIFYIGALSRFSLYPKRQTKKELDVVIVSGPASYAKVFFEKQPANTETDEKTLVLIAPKEILTNTEITTNLTYRIIDSENWKLCDELILQASKLISRSGYSTLMDIYELQVPYKLKPTQGQREQEYLAKLWNEDTYRFTRMQETNKENT